MRYPTKRRLSRQGASEYLSDLGLRISVGTLANWASAGAGPPYLLLFRKAVYAQEDLDAWAETQVKNAQQMSAA
jgi:hypothetical protein